MKITTLVPAYKSTYLVDLLGGMLHQSVKPHKVIFSDDSPNQYFSRALRAEPLKSLVAELDISVVQGPRQGAHANCKHVVETWNGATELFHMLCDDDIIYPNFYERHLQVHQSGTFSTSISRRWTALETGQPVKGQPVPAVVLNHPNKVVSLDAGLAFTTTVACGTNWFGEVSNAVMRAELGEKLCVPRLNGIPYAGLEDLGTVLSGSLVNPVCFINDHLGCFRMNPGQNTALPQGRPMKLAHLAHVALSIAAHRLGKLADLHVAESATIISRALEKRYPDQEDMQGFRGLLGRLVNGDMGAQEPFLAAWKDFVELQG